MALYTFRLPDIGEGIAEAEIVTWHVAVGDVITEDQPVADMMTDKATVEMESPVSGMVMSVAGAEGDMVAIGAALIVVEVEGLGELSTDSAAHSESTTPVHVERSRDTPTTSLDFARDERNDIIQSTPSLPPSRAREVDAMRERDSEASKDAPSPAPLPLASPAVRARAQELGVDLAQIPAGPSGRIRHADLDAFLTHNAHQGYGTPAPPRADETIKIIGMRRRISENMAASKRHIPHFTYVEEIDVTALEEVRGELNANRGTKPKLTMLPLLITAICRALPDYPMINARFDDEAGVVTRYGGVQLGMATQTDAGLMVPVIRDAHDRNIWQLATEITRLADAARNGTAKPHELSGSTLTITSLGPLGGVATTPIINRPEVAIIGPNRIIERPVYVGDAIKRAKLMNLSISCDHRVVDGWDAASFVQAIKRLLETPVLLFAPN